ncbi:CHAT domain-containing protein [Kitasatospora sp. NPDC088134]|uniref:CHAT domain-containing protein n=1 Tax=Kitasatospora sp. NPDC088134 TaxID=3364071 RepID=UPI003811494D
MQLNPDITICLEFQGESVTAVVREGGVALHDAPPARPVAGNLFVPPGRSVSPRVTKSMAEILLPPPVRFHLSRWMEELTLGHMRLRILTPGDGPRDLAALRWEAVRVPGARAPREEWRAWAQEPSVMPADGGQPLGEHPRILLVRSVSSKVRQTVRTPVTIGRVVIADATAVYGEIAVPGADKPVTFAPPPPEASADADRRLVERVASESRLSARTADVPATPRALRRALEGGAEVFYYGGHQLKGGLALAADGPDGREGGEGGTWFSADRLGEMLAEAGVGLAVLMACHSGGGTDEQGKNFSVARRLVRAGVTQVVAVMGEVTHRQAANFARVFFAALVLGEPSDLALREARKVLEGVSALPVLFVREGVGDLVVGMLPEVRDERRAPVAHRLPVEGDGEPDERYRVHLDAWWCLTGRTVVDVLADPTGDDLTGLMTDAERLLALARRRDEASRRWYLWDTPGGRVPRNAVELRNSVIPAYRPAPPGEHRGTGLVLKMDTSPLPPGICRDIERIFRFDPDLRALVLQVTGPHSEQVRSSAKELARLLGHQEYLLRLPAPTATVPARPRRWPGVTGGAGSRGARGLLERLALARRVDGAVPVPEVDVREVVDDLNADGTWGTFDEEREVLNEVRHRWPGLYRSLLEAHARDRVPPRRSASLCMAAARDEDLDRWIGAAGTDLPLPGDVRRQDLTRPLAEAVALALLRANHADTDALDAWAEAAPVAAAAIRVAGRGATGPLPQDLDLVEAAVVLDRAGLLDPVDFTELDPTGSRPGSWALLTRRPLTEESARWVYSLGEEQRRVLGLEPADGAGERPADAELEANLAPYRDALRPPLSFAEEDW